ncbi:hypothetical protein [Nocardia heshunensis]
MICRELGLEGTGERAVYAGLPFSGAHARDGWYLVIDDGGEQLEEMLALPEWSAGCELIRFEVVERAGYSGIERWVDGRRVWAVESGPEDEHAVDVPIYLAEALVGYSYSMGLNSQEPEPFEILQRPETRVLIEEFTARLTEVMTGLGFTRSDPPNPTDLRFTAPAPIPGIQLAVAGKVIRISHGGIRIDGYASIRSESREVESLRFGEMTTEAFLEFVTGPPMEFFASAADPDTFLDAARKPNGHNRISATRVSETVLWALRHGHVEAAADLMAWYLRPYRRLGLRRFGYDPADSHDRAKAFDHDLRQQFPAYDRARQL